MSPFRAPKAPCFMLLPLIDQKLSVQHKVIYNGFLQKCAEDFKKWSGPLPKQLLVGSHASPDRASLRECICTRARLRARSSHWPWDRPARLTPQAGCEELSGAHLGPLPLGQCSVVSPASPPCCLGPARPRPPGTFLLCPGLLWVLTHRFR